jgi:hypothetical protein
MRQRELEFAVFILTSESFLAPSDNNGTNSVVILKLFQRLLMISDMEIHAISSHLANFSHEFIIQSV